ncbi:YebY family protein [Xenorhabdus lircayensis]|uniref:YebY family protein n=1 Tax=Xenorhabdus lircayensis TaxID=2763499 RepID=A0ABS0U1Y4_9GAMM|nr:YebY family protein [Xenorhabdus lircayensis]MBI6547886.1 YebY family protein [Xenorhabdus lircayensis]
MKRISWVLPFLLLSFQGVSAPIQTISKLQFGKQWAFTREEVMLDCRSNEALFVINPSTLMQYPLNDRATQLMKSNKVIATLLDTILLDNPEHPNQKMSIEPFQKIALALCGHSDNKK